MVKRYFRSLILVILIIVLSVMILKRVFPIKYTELIDNYCKEYGISKTLVLGIIKAESGFDENAKSQVGAMGLMQLTEETALWCGEKMGLSLTTEEIKKPEMNIRIGIWYLKYLIERTDSEEIAIISYNAGINKVNEWIDSGVIKEKLKFNDIPYDETRNYIKKVLLYKQIYSILYNINPWQAVCLMLTL